MNRLLVSAAVLGLISSTSGFAQVTPSSTASPTADATIVNAINISSEGSLSFGKIAAPITNPGTVSVDANGDLNSPENLSTGDSTGSVPTFTVTGEAGQAYTVTLNNTAWDPTGVTPVTIQLSDGTNTMNADVYKSGGNSTVVGGSDSFKAIGTLHVPAGQPAGSYSTTFDVTVAYN